jgi:hypothetical protein
MKRASRKPSNLSQSLHQRLNSYALAASAAGVSLLALVQPTEARVVYTRANRNIFPDHVIPLDLNHDGLTDFIFTNRLDKTQFSSFGSDWLSVVPSGANRVWGHETTSQHSHRYASALQAGFRISGAFSRGRGYMAYGHFFSGTYVCHGQWKNLDNHYLGLKFHDRKGETHFGWARLNVSCNTYKIDATLTGYAYETIPNKAIIAGRTKGPDVITLRSGSLGHLARGGRTR